MEKLDRYELLEVVGTGAFATVWKAYDPVLEMPVAIKVLADNWSRDPEMRQRFLGEARLALDITSPHLIRVHHVAEAADTTIPYIVMTLAEGGTLEQRLVERRLNPFSVNEALLLVREIAIGVGALHDEGVLHRDLKPANVLFHTRRGQEQPLLGDFGLARALDKSALTMVSGTPAYAAPEQAAGLTQLTKQADLFSLGIMFLEMITGNVPERDNMIDAATQAVDVKDFLADNDIQLNPDQSQFVTQLIDTNPENRPSSAHQVAAQIDELLSNEPAPAATATPQTIVRTMTSEPPLVPLAEEPDAKRVPLLPLIAAVVLLAVVLGAVFSLTRNDNTLATDAGAQAVEASSSTTIEPETPTTEADIATTTTTLPVTVTDPPDQVTALNVIPTDFPLPTGALLDSQDSNANLLQIYRLAGTIDEVTNFYRTTPGWTIQDTTTDTTLAALVITNGAETISVVAEPIETTAGIDLTLLTIMPAGS